jgi:proteic killer suppression protein
VRWESAKYPLKRRQFSRLDRGARVVSADELFPDQATMDLWSGDNTKVARKRLPAELWENAREKLGMLDAATDVLRDLGAVPSLRLKKLEGDQAGRWAIRINDPYRITFAFDAATARDVWIGDYH